MLFLKIFLSRKQACAAQCFGAFWLHGDAQSQAVLTARAHAGTSAPPKQPAARWAYRCNHSLNLTLCRLCARGYMGMLIGKHIRRELPGG